MSETSDELQPLPEEGPATLSGVKLRTKIDVDDTADDVELADLVDSINAWIRGDETTGAAALPITDRYRGAAAWGKNVVLGANMLGARLWRRKGTPGGVEVFGDGGVAYVQRTDPDVAMLLELGDWSRPAAE